jgi:GntR family transcriptional repressor for pyruvate dehydrogenase complex
VLGVSRPAVREALKRLSAAGLVEVRQGDRTTGRDFRRHAGLDLLPRLLVRNGELDVAVARSILETRLHNGRSSVNALRSPSGTTLSTVPIPWHPADVHTLRLTYEPALPALATLMSAEVGRRRHIDSWPQRSPPATRRAQSVPRNNFPNRRRPR